MSNETRKGRASNFEMRKYSNKIAGEQGQRGRVHAASAVVLGWNRNVPAVSGMGGGYDWRRRRCGRNGYGAHSWVEGSNSEKAMLDWSFTCQSNEWGGLIHWLYSPSFGAIKCIFSIRDCYIVLLTNRMRGCIRAAPYVDEFGEVDQGFRWGYGRLRVRYESGEDRITIHWGYGKGLLIDSFFQTRQSDAFERGNVFEASPSLAAPEHLRGTVDRLGFPSGSTVDIDYSRCRK